MLGEMCSKENAVRLWNYLIYRNTCALKGVVKSREDSIEVVWCSNEAMVFDRKCGKSKSISEGNIVV